MITKQHTANGVASTAIYSECEKYRYQLTRVWNPRGRHVLFIGLNPSTATEMKNDPTITRIINFAKQWGFGSVSICNLFAFRATFPKDLKQAQDPIGPHNITIINQAAKDADLVVAAWGNHGTFKNQSAAVKEFLEDFSHFGYTKIGEPKHPLYLRSDAKLTTNH